MSLEYDKVAEAINSGDVNGHYAVGRSETIRMKYKLKLQHVNGGPKIDLAHTTSFKQGVSVSGITWGLINSGSSNTNTDTKIEFTLHDIAGEMLNKFMLLTRGDHYILFKGPRSNGELWEDKYLYFKPIRDDCNIEFSQTGGFTYSIGGMPIAHMAKSSSGFVLNNEFTVNGFMDSIDDGSTFEEYLNNVVVDQWNENISDEDKKTKKIKEFILEADGLEDRFKAKTTNPEAADGNAEDNEKPDTIKDLTFSTGSTISDVVSKLFHTRFEAIKDEEDQDGASFSCNYGGIEEDGNGEHVFVLSINDKKNEELTEIQSVCIGSDKNCIGQPFRGQLSNMNLGDIVKVASSMSYDLGDGTNTDPEDADEDGANDDESAEGNQMISGNMFSGSQQGLDEENNPNSAWGIVNKTLDDVKTPAFTIEVSMPYSFGFSTKDIGGLLASSFPENLSSNAIKYTQGVKLSFYWYKDVNCETLIKSNVFSQKYRLDKVTHNIGSSGNTTVISLSHMYTK